MFIFRLFPFILSWSWVENAAIPTQFVRHFSVFICSHTEELGWIGFLTARLTLNKLWLYEKIRISVRHELSLFNSPWKDLLCFTYWFNHLGAVVLFDLIYISSASPFLLTIFYIFFKWTEGNKELHCVWFLNLQRDRLIRKFQGAVNFANTS